MKAKNDFNRTAKQIDGASEANSPRTHAAEGADQKAKKANPQRMDILRRHALSSRNKDQ
jgi:hypothetical protein